MAARSHGASLVGKRGVMTERVLLAYASRHGTTGEVAEAIGDTLRGLGVDVDVRQAHDVHGLEGYDAVVLGAPFYMNRWHKQARSFLRRQRKTLAALPVAVFALGPLSTDEQEFAQVRGLLDAVLADVEDVEPLAVEVFGGALDPVRLHFPFNHMDAADVRDWAAIQAFAERLPELLGVPVAAQA